VDRVLLFGREAPRRERIKVLFHGLRVDKREKRCNHGLRSQHMEQDSEKSRGDLGDEM
jgi:hypothetical protein